MDLHLGSALQIIVLERTSWCSSSGLSVVDVNLCQGRGWLDFRKMFFPQGDWNRQWSRYQSSRSVWTTLPGTGWDFGIVLCRARGWIDDPCDSLAAQGVLWFREQMQPLLELLAEKETQQIPASSRVWPQPGPRKTIAATGKTNGTAQQLQQEYPKILAGKSVGCTGFLHVWTRMFLGCVDSPEVPQLLTTTHQQRFISSP